VKRRTRRYAQDLRLAIDCLPVRTREAMLDGLQAQHIIVGAYTTSDGGICPMLAAHRAGGRTSLAAFAKAWDRYTGAAGRPRPASGRELRTLYAMLEASLWAEDPRPELEAAVRAARDAKARRDERAATGERHRTAELRPGWAWLRVFRRYDEFEAALERAELHEAETAPTHEREPV
jgi:hypothetical protein